MRNFMANFARILGICKGFAGNRVNAFGNVPRRGVVPKFSDLGVMALGVTAEAFSFDSENYLFHRLYKECKNDLPNLITRRQFNARRKLTPQAAPAWGCCASQGMYYYGCKLHAVCGISGVVHSFDITSADVHDIHYLKDVKWEYHDCMMLADKGYLSAENRKDLFEVAHIEPEVPYRLNQKNRKQPSWAYKKFRKRIETIFSQLNDHLMMIRNYAKHTFGLFSRMAGKIAAMTFMQYVNFVNQRPIGQEVEGIALFFEYGSRASILSFCDVFL